MTFLDEFGINCDYVFMATPVEGVNPGVKAERLDAPFRALSLFINVLNLFGRPTETFLEDLSKVAEPGATKKRLVFLVSDEEKQAFSTDISGESLTYADVLLKFPSVKPDLNQLITMLPSIKPRLYTIASSTRDTPGFIELTVITDE